MWSQLWIGVGNQGNIIEGYLLNVYLLFIDEDLVVLYSYSFIKLFKRWYCILTIFDRNLDLPLVFCPKNNYERARNTIKKGEGAR